MYEDQSLKSLAEKISENVKHADECLNQADQRVAKAAQMLVEAKKRVYQGDAADVGWYEWAKTHIGLNKSRLDELHSIGSADNPLDRARKIRELGKARVQRHRNKKKASPLRDGEESKTEGSAPPAAETETGAPAPNHGPNSEPDRNNETARDIQSPLEASEPHSAEDKERAELIRMFTEWAKTADINELRGKVKRIVDPLALPGFLDRRQKKDAA